MTDKLGNILATTDIMAGNHNDQYELKEKLKTIFSDLLAVGISVRGSLFNMDAGFDSRAVRKFCFNRGIRPNIKENPRNRKTPKRGPKRFFDKDCYAHRVCIERTFAWVDKFKRLLLRFEREDVYFKGWHFIAFSLINLRHRIAESLI